MEKKALDGIVQGLVCFHNETFPSRFQGFRLLSTPLRGKE
tara:strand:+ start:536 stop:655 length:120 start_codon:yes stop_codon:yes gene_type:complete